MVDNVEVGVRDIIYFIVHRKLPRLQFELDCDQ